MNISSKIAKHVISVPPSGIRKFFDIASEIKDAISLSVGEPDFVTPWKIREAAIYSLEKGHTHYTSNSGITELRELICEYYFERFGVKYTLDQALVTVGASEAIDLALRAIIDPGDEVIIPGPSYVSYAPCVAFANGVPVEARTSAETGFKMTPEEIKRLITPKTKAILLAYPNNPTGTTLTREEYAELVKVIEQTDIIVISDEIYAELSYDNKHTCVASFDSMYDRTIVINGFSKAFSMTGWRLGYALGNRELIAAMRKIHQYSMLCAGTTSQYAGIEALKYGFETDFADVDAMVREYNRRRNIIVNGLREIGLECNMPGGAFYAYPSIKSTGLSSQEFCGQLLNSQKVAIVPGDAFGPSGEGYARISYAASIDKIVEALKRIKTFVNSL